MSTGTVLMNRFRTVADFRVRFFGEVQHAAQLRGINGCRPLTSGMVCSCRLPVQPPNCPVPIVPSPHEYRLAETSLPRVLCLGDSVSLPSCRAAANHSLLVGRLELRSIEFVSNKGLTIKQLNSMGSHNLVRCLPPWASGSCKVGVKCPLQGEQSALHWKAIVLGAGAWDLSTGFGACCSVSESRLSQLVHNVKASVEQALRFADIVVWVTTAPAPEHAGCCNVPTYNYSGREHLSGAPGTIGFCNGDAQEQNRRVATVLRASFPPSRVAIADTFEAVNARCGRHYADCSIQGQFTTEGRPVSCNVHFSAEAYLNVHGPVVARTLAQAVF